MRRAHLIRQPRRTLGRSSACVIAAASLAVIAGCSPQAPAPSTDKAAPAAPGAAQGIATEFRLMQAETTAKSGATRQGPMDGKLYRSGDKTRMEFNDPERGPVVIITTATETILIGTEDGKTAAIKVPLQGLADMVGVSLPDFAKGEWLTSEDGSKATQVGPCSAAGESGTLYRVVEPDRTGEACVAADGVILEGKENGTVVWQTTKVTRGPQPAELFTTPPGIEVVDMEAMMKGFGAELEKMAKDLQTTK
jgi:hypothetical protein